MRPPPGHKAIEDAPRPHPRIMLRAGEFLRPYRGRWLLTLLLTLLVSATQLAGPWLKQQGIDRGITPGNFSLLMKFVWLMLLAHGLNVACAFWWGQLITWLGQQTIHDLRVALFSHLQQLSLDYYEKEQPGRIISRAINDLEAVSDLITGGAIVAVGDLFLLVGISVILVRYQPALGLMVILLLPVMVGIALLFQKRIRAIFTKTRETIAALTSYLHETVSGIRVVKTLARERLSERHFLGLNQANQKAVAAAGGVFAYFMPAVEIAQYTAVALVFWYGGKLVAGGAMKIGVILAFILYIYQFFDPVRRLIDLFASVPQALVGLNRILEILDKEPSVKEAPQAKVLAPFSREVEFKGVGFSYDGRHPILKDIDFTAHFGEVVALVGHTGAGKSSMMKLLSRLYDVQEGEILVDGQNLREVTLASLRGQMGMVQQETFLFSGSVRENIRFSRPEASDEEVEQAAKTVFADEFIRELPQGYDTDISERGVRLSGGQRQLVSFARAVLRNPRILILDEATSSVDHFTEVHIQEAMKTLMQNRVSFVIAHRISTVREADLILVMQEGRIISRGKHEELAANCPTYRRLYQRRFLAKEK
jgi:ATP-binding cassette, subfamily B, multidrug efflux pump